MDTGTENALAALVSGAPDDTLALVFEALDARYWAAVGAGDHRAAEDLRALVRAVIAEGLRRRRLDGARR